MRTAIFLSLLALPALGQTVIRVDADAAGGGDGSSWGTAFDDLGDALFEAGTLPPPVELWIAEGIYTPAGPGGSRQARFELVSGVALYGGFDGSESNLGERDPALNVTRLSGDLNGNDGPNFTNRGDNSYHVVFGSGTALSTRVDGLVIEGGQADHAALGSPERNGGGAFFAAGGSATFVDCVLRDNLAHSTAGKGGALYVENGSATLSSCEVSDNAGGEGAGVWLSGTLTVTDSTLIGNIASNGARNGGGLLVQVGSLALTGCHLEKNRGLAGGGAYVGSGASVAVVDCAFVDNQATDGGGLAAIDAPVLITTSSFHENSATTGGGLGLFGCSGLVVDCNFRLNSATAGGGLKLDSFTTAEVRNCDFRENFGVANAGAAVVHGPALLVDCLFENNEGAGADGAMQIAGGDPTLRRCIFRDNFVDAPGGGAGGALGIFVASPFLEDCVFENNSLATEPPDDIGSSTNAGRGGGAVWSVASQATFVNCRFTGNSVTSSGKVGGGAVCGLYDFCRFVNCTFADNSLSSPQALGGSALYSLTLWDFSGVPLGGDPQVENCVLWGNQGGAPVASHALSTVTVSDSCVEGGHPGNGVISSDPLFVDSASGDLHLGAGSPCIDQGLDSHVPAGILTDLDGNPRFVDGLGAGGPTVDMGAYEAPPGDFATPYCFGVGCPCGNDDQSAGCANSTGVGGQLLAVAGTGSVSVDDLILRATGLPLNQNGLVFMGGGQANAVIGDGLLCISGGASGIFRYGVQNTGSQGVLTLGPGITSLSQQFAMSGHIAAGETWHFQVWHRDPQGPCGSGTNFSNAIAVTFTP
ncbi:MAG: right-handed parallel beta-helix repeat-containing protein [Planctomycetota bacterium]|nr:right-handed parallel beta-helix repeat-containing protein [Planctomycetota bacterium]